jgi:hypothetical protein
LQILSKLKKDQQLVEAKLFDLQKRHQTVLDCGLERKLADSKALNNELTQIQAEMTKKLYEKDLKIESLEIRVSELMARD